MNAGLGFAFRVLASMALISIFRVVSGGRGTLHDGKWCGSYSALTPPHGPRMDAGKRALMLQIETFSSEIRDLIAHNHTR